MLHHGGEGVYAPPNRTDGRALPQPLWCFGSGDVSSHFSWWISEVARCDGRSQLLGGVFFSQFRWSSFTKLLFLIPFRVIDQFSSKASVEGFNNYDLFSLLEKQNQQHVLGGMHVRPLSLSVSLSLSLSLSLCLSLSLSLCYCLPVRLPACLSLSVLTRCVFVWKFLCPRIHFPA